MSSMMVKLKTMSSAKKSVPLHVHQELDVQSFELLKKFAKKIDQQTEQEPIDERVLRRGEKEDGELLPRVLRCGDSLLPVENRLALNRKRFRPLGEGGKLRILKNERALVVPMKGAAMAESRRGSISGRPECGPLLRCLI